MIAFRPFLNQLAHDTGTTGQGQEIANVIKEQWGERLQDIIQRDIKSRLEPKDQEVLQMLIDSSSVDHIESFLGKRQLSIKSVLQDFRAQYIKLEPPKTGFFGRMFR